MAESSSSRVCLLVSNLLMMLEISTDTQEGNVPDIKDGICSLSRG